MCRPLCLASLTRKTALRSSRAVPCRSGLSLPRQESKLLHEQSTACPPALGCWTCSCLQFLVIMNVSSGHICVRPLGGRTTSLLRGEPPGQNCWVTGKSRSTVQETHKLFPEVAGLSHIPNSDACGRKKHLIPCQHMLSSASLSSRTSDGYCQQFTKLAKFL